MSLYIAIDGACRRNGKPDCVSAAGVFIREFDEGNRIIRSRRMSNFETNSTNQRGELHALLLALEHVLAHNQQAFIITDSEYIFNTMTKGWYTGWQSRGWKTSTGDPVKNSDLWKRIVDTYNACKSEVLFYHVKGHCISIGKVTATSLLESDNTGDILYEATLSKYDTVCSTSRAEALKAAQELSVKNNGFGLVDNLLKLFVCLNTVADIIATRTVELADSLTT